LSVDDDRRSGDSLLATVESSDDVIDRLIILVETAWRAHISHYGRATGPASSGAPAS
jgi:hypothetical protein